MPTATNRTVWTVVPRPFFFISYISLLVSFLYIKGSIAGVIVATNKRKKRGYRSSTFPPSSPHIHLHATIMNEEEDIQSPQESAGVVVYYNPPSDDVPSKADNNNNHGDEKKEKQSTNKDPLATIGELFSFAHTTKIKVLITCGFLCSLVTGAVFPGTHRRDSDQKPNETRIYAVPIMDSNCFFLFIWILFLFLF